LLLKEKILRENSPDSEEKKKVVKKSSSLIMEMPKGQKISFSQLNKLLCNEHDSSRPLFSEVMEKLTVIIGLYKGGLK